MPKEVPDDYSTPIGNNPKLIEISNSLYNKLKSSKNNGLRFFENNIENVKGVIKV